MPAPVVEFSLISDFATVIDRLHILSDQMQQKGARAAARKAMVPVRNEARAKAKLIDDPRTNDPTSKTKKYSMIWKNIVINESQRGGRRVGGIVMRVGVRGGSLSRVERTLESGKGLRFVSKGVYRQVKKFGKIKKHIIHPGGDTRHWRFVELGTQRMRARAFMLPAFIEKQGEVIDTLATELEKQIDKLAHYHVTAHP